jgi:hypothetical protein
MIDKVVRGLRAVSPDLTVEEILDVLWLSANYPGDQPGQADADNAGVPPAEESEPGPEEPQGDTPGLPSYPPGQPRDREDGAPATAIGFDAPRLLRDVVTPPMAMRRLRKVRVAAPRQAVDIDATVEATAEATAEARMRVPTLTRPLLMPKLTRPPQPALDLALVVDESSSMRIWDDVLDDLERLLAQTGAFRSVSRWQFSPGEGTIRPHTRFHKHDRPSQRPEQLVDPSGRRLVFVATDARDRTWYDNPPWEALSTWCAAMPTVLVQVLPPQYWSNTAVGAPYMTSRALTPGAPNSQYQRRIAWWSADPGGHPLPVVTLAEKSLDNKSLDSWAQSVVNGTAWATGITAAAPDSAPPDEADADAAVNEFLAKATPGALRLARVLASADTPLSMPLISVLRERLAPKTGVAELAEIMASDLLEEIEPTTEDVESLLRYRSGTRAILYRGTTAFEEWDALAVVGNYLDERRRSGPLRIYIPDRRGSARFNADDKPFHDFHHALAVHLGLRSDTSDLVEDGREPVEAAAEPTEEMREPVVAAPALADTVAGTAPDESPRRDATQDESRQKEALLAALAAELAQLDDVDGLTIAAFEAEGISAWRVRRDENGTPQSRKSVLATPPIVNPAEFYVRQLASSPTDSRLLITVGALNESRAAVLRLLRAAREAPVFECHEPLDDLLRASIRNSSLTRWYDLVVLNEAGNGELQVDYRPLFQPGATRGDRSESFTVRCAPGEDSGTAFAVIARKPGARRSPPDRLHPVQFESAVVPPGIYRLTALLSRPGRVQFEGLPARLVDEERSFARLIRQIPQRLPTTEPVHLVCVVEVGGDREQLRHRIDRLEELIAVADGGGRPLAVSVVSYGAHAVMRGMHEEPATVRAWATTPYEAISALGGLLSREVPDSRQEYQRAAQIECALDEVSRRLSQHSGHPVVVTVGGRPPHPPKVDLYTEIIPCPKRLDWQALIARLRENPRIRFGALCDPGAVRAIWRELGRDALAATDVADIHHFARLLGLQEPALAMPFPLLVLGAAAANQAPRPTARQQNAVRLGGIAMLGSPGSGKNTFLSALNVTLQRGQQTPGDWTLAGQHNNPAKSGIETATAPLERALPRPPAVTGEMTQFTLVQRGAQRGLIVPRDRPGEVARRSSTEIALSLVDPGGELWSDQPRPQRQEVIREVSDTDGILYLFDPIREFEVGDTYSFITRIISQVSQETASGRAQDFHGTLPHHVAVCVTKFDEPRVLATVRRMGVVTTDPGDRYGFPRVRDSDARRVFAKLCNGDGEMVLNTMDRTFRRDRVRYFVTSAIGFRTDPETGRFDAGDPQNIAAPSPGAASAKPRIRGPVNPINVVEPVLWLAEQIART